MGIDFRRQILTSKVDPRAVRVDRLAYVLTVDGFVINLYDIINPLTVSERKTEHCRSRPENVFETDLFGLSSVAVEKNTPRK